MAGNGHGFPPHDHKYEDSEARLSFDRERFAFVAQRRCSVIRNDSRCPYWFTAGIVKYEPEHYVIPVVKPPPKDESE